MEKWIELGRESPIGIFITWRDLTHLLGETSANSESLSVIWRDFHLESSSRLNSAARGETRVMVDLLNKTHHHYHQHVRLILFTLWIQYAVDRRIPYIVVSCEASANLMALAFAHCTLCLGKCMSRACATQQCLLRAS